MRRAYSWRKKGLNHSGWRMLKLILVSQQK
ncbi:unnamed protein product [Nezara viridula]|uniref:Uncharacterized protein n=1 Tax=Nezara viridula TaxID=85310 RepID=A0A9P0HCH1_NEZVI|nr:unnamed protein product [Nezara viridula]